MKNDNPDKPVAGQVEPPAPVIKAGWLRALVFLVVLVCFLVPQSLVVIFVFDFKLTEVEDFTRLFDQPVMMILQAVFLVTLLALVLLFRRLIDRRSLMSLGFSLGRSDRKDLLAGLAWGAGTTTVIFLVLWASDLVQVTGIRFPLVPLAVVALTTVLAVIQEELIMRGYLLNNLMASVNRYLALLFIAVLFGASHGMNPGVSWVGLGNVLLAGLFLGVYYVHRQNLWFPIGMHFTWNYFQGVVFGSPVSGIDMVSILELEFTGPGLLTGGEFGFEASVITSAVAAASTVIIHLVYRPR